METGNNPKPKTRTACPERRRRERSRSTQNPESIYTLPFERCDANAHAQVGGKNASLGSMLQADAPVPPGFAVTTDAYKKMLDTNGLNKKIQALLETLSPEDVEDIETTSQTIRALIEQTPMPSDVEQAIRTAYANLCQKCAPIEPTTKDTPAQSKIQNVGPACTRRGPYLTALKKIFPMKKFI